MDAKASPILLTLARVGAVLLAVGALGYFVVTAQGNANPSDTAPDAAPVGGGDASPAPEGKHFLPSSKSIAIDPADLQPAEADAEKPDLPEYLPSTKGMILPKEKIVPPGKQPSGAGTSK